MFSDNSYEDNFAQSHKSYYNVCTLQAMRLCKLQMQICWPTKYQVYYLNCPQMTILLDIDNWLDTLYDTLPTLQCIVHIYSNITNISVCRKLSIWTRSTTPAPLSTPIFQTILPRASHLMESTGKTRQRNKSTMILALDW